MFDNDYENYMRSVLGYPIQDEINSYNNAYVNNNSYFPYRSGNMYVTDNKYENLYPDIYKILRPMIHKICNLPNNKSLSNDELEKMADEIYKNIESETNVVNINIKTSSEAESSKSSMYSKRDTKVSQKTSQSEEKRSCCSNPTLKDLIKILILNQLRENNAHRPPRPQMPPHGHYPFHLPNYRELQNSEIYNNNYNSDQFYN